MNGKELRAWRKRQGLTQAKLAEVIGVSLRTVVYWENGHPITHEKMLGLACERLERDS